MSYLITRDRFGAVTNLEVRLRQIEEERGRLKEPHFDDRFAKCTLFSHYMGLKCTCINVELFSLFVLALQKYWETVYTFVYLYTFICLHRYMFILWSFVNLFTKIPFYWYIYRKMKNFRKIFNILRGATKKGKNKIKIQMASPCLGSAWLHIAHWNADCKPFKHSKMHSRILIMKGLHMYFIKQKWESFIRKSNS